MALSIPLIGLSSSDPVPGSYIQIDFGTGPSSSGQTNYSAILIGNMLSTGSAEVDGYVYGPDTQIQLTSESEAIDLFGEGSELHRMYRRFLAVNKVTSLYAAPVKESTGSQASGTITFVGTANASGTVRIYVGDEFVDVGIVSGDTPTVQAVAAVNAINQRSYWAVSSSSSAGVVTITSKQKGLRYNLIRISARVLNKCGVTVTPAAPTLLSGGTVSDSNANVLLALSGTRYYYYVSGAEDSTQVTAITNQINSMSQPLVGLRQRAVVGSVETLGNATTIAVAQNAARVEVIWQEKSDLLPSELASNAAAVYSLFEASSVPECNFSGFGNSGQTSQFWLIKQQLTNVTLTRNQIKSALLNGLTPIAPSRGGNTYLVKRITSRSLNGSVNDYRIRDSHKVTICDRYADDLISRQVNQLSQKLIGNDPVEGQPAPGPKVVTPRVMKALVDQLTKEYGGLDLLENVQEIVANTQVIREANPNTRLSVKVPLDIADIADQFASLISQEG